MLDLVIKGGLVVTPSGAALMDLWIKGEHITGIVSAGSEAPEAKKTIDVSGKIVVPGGIEPHAHIGFSQLGNTWFAQNAGPAEQSLAAIWGGTTTLVDAGTAGPGNFTGFRAHVIEVSAPRILAFLNISFAGIDPNSSKTN